MRRNITGARQLFGQYCSNSHDQASTSSAMNDIIYIVGLIVVVMFILSALGLR